MICLQRLRRKKCIVKILKYSSISQSSRYKRNTHVFQHFYLGTKNVDQYDDYIDRRREAFKPQKGTFVHCIKNSFQ